MMTIFIKDNEIQEFKKILKDFKVRHGPFRKHYNHIGHGRFHQGYQIDILDPGPIKTYLRLKFSD